MDTGFLLGSSIGNSCFDWLFLARLNNCFISLYSERLLYSERYIWNPYFYGHSDLDLTFVSLRTYGTFDREPIGTRGHHGTIDLKPIGTRGHYDLDK